MAIIIIFQEYVKESGKINQYRGAKDVSSEIGRIVYFNKKDT